MNGDRGLSTRSPRRVPRDAPHSRAACKVELSTSRVVRCGRAANALRVWRVGVESDGPPLVSRLLTQRSCSCAYEHTRCGPRARPVASRRHRRRRRLQMRVPRVHEAGEATCEIRRRHRAFRLPAAAARAGICCFSAHTNEKRSDVGTDAEDEGSLHRACRRLPNRKSHWEHGADTQSRILTQILSVLLLIS